MLPRSETISIASIQVRSGLSAQEVPGLVSVIIPTYNRSRLLVDSMKSVQTQTYRPIEIIVVDDGSVDNTAGVVAAFGEHVAGDSEMTLRRLAQSNRGVSAARNRGLENSYGEFIQYLDSDDFLYPTKIEMHAQAMLADEDIDYVYSPIEFRDSSGRRELVGRDIPAGKDADWAARYCWCTLGALYRRRACLRVGMWDEDLRAAEDLVYQARVLLSGLKRKFIPAVCGCVPAHSGPRLTLGDSYKMSEFRELAATRIADYLRSAGLRSRVSTAALMSHLISSGCVMRAYGDVKGWCRCRAAVRLLAKESGSYALQAAAAIQPLLDLDTYKGFLCLNTIVHRLCRIGRRHAKEE